MAESKKKVAASEEKVAKKAAPKKATKKAEAPKKAAPAKKAPAKKAGAKKEVAQEVVTPKESTPKAKKEPKAPSAKKFALPTPHDYEVIKAPLVTEKSLKLMQTENKITLKVAKEANSTEIKQAFEAIFNKRVERVNIINVRSREKRVGRYAGTVGGYKKAIIKLAAGETLDLFEEDKK
ncbi:MAG: 50S ribosomal protein L23 [Bacilli bacterium]|nr:50S ribosomal protein L23 [Bacilli bacterium]